MQNKASDLMRENFLSGYRHHPYALEQEISRLLEQGQWDLFDTGILSLETYADVLAPDRLRAMKNALICFTALISRGAISRGVAAEKSFSVSDHYIYEIEKQHSPLQLKQVLRQILMEYSQLEEDARACLTSLPVGRALAYIKEHIYGRCRVADAAKAAGYDPQYFAVVFRQEMGMAPSEYIRQQKLQEAATLLRSGSCTATEVAHSLGYCSASHFGREFTRYFGIGPRAFVKNGGIALQNQK